MVWSLLASNPTDIDFFLLYKTEKSLELEDFICSNGKTNSEYFRPHILILLYVLSLQEIGDHASPQMTYILVVLSRFYLFVIISGMYGRTEAIFCHQFTQTHQVSCFQIFFLPSVCPVRVKFSKPPLRKKFQFSLVSVNYKCLLCFHFRYKIFVTNFDSFSWVV